MTEPLTTPAAGQAMRSEPSADNRLVWRIFVADMPWPGDDDSHFEIEIPQPAIFQRVIRFETYKPILGRRVPVMRLIWMVGVLPHASASFLLQRLGQSVAASADRGAEFLGILIGGNGEPIALWQTSDDACPVEASEAPKSE